MALLNKLQRSVKTCGFVYGRHQFAELPSRLLTTTSSKLDVDDRPLKKNVETVIIGGGVVGVSIAYHLAKLGQKDVLLLEKSELTAGSTWHAAGLTTFFHPGINVKRIHYYSLHLYDRLEHETGQNVGLHKCGSIRLADSKERVDEFRYQMSRQNWNQAIQRLITPDEIRRLHPLLNMEGILAGLYTPGDGHIDPYSLTQALAIGARMYGADVRTATAVTSTDQLSDGRWHVETTRGSVTAGRLVNAAGLWARECGKLVGLDLPLVPVHHQYVVTGPIAAVQALDTELPVIRDLTGSYYMRQERNGLLFGPYEHENKMRLCDDWYRDGVPRGFGRELFESDLDRLQVHTEQAMNNVPVLKDAEIQRVVCGPITYSPDVLPLLGPVGGHLHNYWLAVGFGYGIVHAGGVGRFIAEWILSGEPPYDLIECDSERFGRWVDSTYVLRKSRESYGLNNLIMYPREERPAGRPTTTREGSLYSRLKARGAQFGFHSGWEQPNWFASAGDDTSYKPSFRRTNWFEPMNRECKLVMNGAGVIDLTPFGKFDVCGRDAARLLDRLTANSLPSVGRTVITHLLTERGRVYAEWTITRFAEDQFFCITGSGSEFHDLRWLDDEIWRGGYDVTVTNVTDSLGCIGLAGPLSRQVLEPLLDRTNNVDLSENGWPFLHARRELNVAGVKTRAVRISYTGELGWELYTDKKDMPRLYDALTQSPTAAGDFGTFAMNALRIEKGFRAWGSEMNVDTDPFEAGLGPFVRLDKATDFIGKESLKRILVAADHKQQSGRRHLVLLSLANSGPDEKNAVDPNGNEAVWFGDRVVGNTTSGSYGPTIGRSIAFAYVPRELSTPGTEVHIELIGERRLAVVEKGPPVKVESIRARQQKRRVAAST